MVVHCRMHQRELYKHETLGIRKEKKGAGDTVIKSSQGLSLEASCARHSLEAPKLTLCVPLSRIMPTLLKQTPEAWP